ncbi:hypothetical protein JJJ17_14765 [Paracoccus caeni]|uniref:Transmembrane protein n=1 Tax=Paracoccus caeni TaxID=657651 RepID=A0A934SE32_9RHOB|nr:hypothetical protein [Paracoccus caeni]MBK4217191.1 hypothetical protein [Paracoccus caeni]
MTQTDNRRLVRADRDQPVHEYIIVLFTLLILFNAYPISVAGFHWIWLPAVIIAAFSIAKLIERRFPSNRFHLLVQAPILLVGPIWLCSVGLTLETAGRMHGLWLILLILGVLHAVIVNALVLRYLNLDGMIQTMVRRGWITASDGIVEFVLPYRLDRRAGLPDWLYRLILAGRIFWIAVCVFGAVAFGGGVYSSVNITERLLNTTGTLALGMAVLFTRLWQTTLFLAVQRKFETGPLSPSLRKKPRYKVVQL